MVDTRKKGGKREGGENNTMNGSVPNYINSEREIDADNRLMEIVPRA